LTRNTFYKILILMIRDY